MGMWNINTIDDDIKVPPKTAAQVYFWARNALDKLKRAITPPQLHVFELLDGHKVTQCLCVAMRLGIADQLNNGPKACSDLARVLNVNADALYRVMRLLASKQIFKELPDRRFELTPAAALLRIGGKNSLRALAGLIDQNWPTWEHLIDSVRTGQPMFEKVFGMPIFDYYAKHPEKSELFDQAMAESSRPLAKAIVTSYAFSGIDRLVDIGGGDGSLLSAILRAHPRMTATLFEGPWVAGRARRSIAAAGLGDRCEVVAGDFFASVPAGGDAYLLKHILHDWNDERALTLLESCHRAMKPGARLLIAELIIPPGNEPFVGKELDIQMLIATGGRERTKEEYEALLHQAGFKLRRVVPTPFVVCVIEAVRT
jgi:SAM-dependent methyltransferase